MDTASARRLREAAARPTVLHLTHYKAGSQWVYAILRMIAGRRIVAPRADLSQFLDAPIAAGSVYPTLYLTRSQFEAAEMPDGSRRFVVIRDLRDTLVSAYYSVKISHRPFEIAAMRRLRAELQELDELAGMARMLDEWLPLNAEIQRSWLAAGPTERIVRYEDLIEDDEECFDELLRGHCGLRVSRLRLRRAVRRARFERQTGGRPRGREDTSSHHRLGIVGDWRRALPEPVLNDLERRFGTILTTGGYKLHRPESTAAGFGEAVRTPERPRKESELESDPTNRP